MKYSRPIFIACVSFVYFVLYSISVVIYESQTLSSHLKDASGNISTESVIYAIESYERAFLFILFLTVSRLVFAIFLPMLFLCSAIAAYFINMFKIQITEHVIPVFFEATPHEIASFTSVQLFVWCALSLAISFICIRLFLLHDKKDVNKKRNRIFVFVAGAFTLFSLILSGHNTNSNYMPYNYLKSTGKYILSKFYKIGKEDISLHHANFKGKDNLIVVMVIGESARSDHFSLNGYERETNPKLSKITNLLNFKYVTSCDNLTRLSVPCMLTRATHSNRTAVDTETSFVSIFRRLGFKTIWIDNQRIKNSFIDSGITSIINEAEQLISTLNPDSDLVGDANILPFLADMLNKNNGKLLVVIHTYGSHWHYDSLYDEQHHQWDPVCKKSIQKSDNTSFLKIPNYETEMSQCPHQSLINSYDNTILQTDYVISEVINMLKEKNSILLYSSDHGESLGEGGLLFHGQSDVFLTHPEQFHVPLMLWASDEFIKHNTEKFSNAHSKTGQNISHDFIFHSLLNCAGVESDVIDKSLSLCMKQLKK